MAEYIEREKALVECDWYANEFTEAEYAIMPLRGAIRNIPAADVAPVRHGRWVSVPHKKARICSRCEQDEPYKFADVDANVFDYCPNCGAKMDGGAE